MSASDKTGCFVHPSAIVDEPCRIDAGTKIWHFCHIMSGCRIGDGSSLGQNCFVASGVQIGRNVKIQNNVSIYEGVELEDDVFCGPSMVFTNIVNPRSAIVRKGQYRRTIVRRGATIGANATIVCGHEIGEYAFIGAGAVVTDDVLPYALMLGVPARHCGWMSRYGQRLDFNEDGLARCPESGEEYTLAANGMVYPVDHAPVAEGSTNTRGKVVNKSQTLQPNRMAQNSPGKGQPAAASRRGQFTRRSVVSQILLVASITYYVILCWLLLSPSPIAYLPDVCHRILNSLDLENYYHFCLFMPVGFLLAARWVCVGGWLDVTAALTFAAGSEALQYFLPSRDVSVVDFAQNLAGLALGAGVVGIGLSFALMSQANSAFESGWAGDETNL